MGYAEWSDVPGCVGGTLYVKDGKTYNECTDTHLTALDKYNFPENEVIELDIHFQSSGYHLPASMYGGSQNTGWPAEHEDEREIKCIKVTAGAKELELPEETIDEIVFDFEDLIKDAELDEGDF